MNPIVSLILIGAAVWGFFGFIEPRYDHIKDLRKQRADYMGALDQVRKIEDKLASLRASYGSISADDLDHLKKLLPDTVDTVRMILDIDSVAARHSMALREIEIENPSALKSGETPVGVSDEVSPVGEPGSSFGRFKISFSVVAPYDKLVGFLSDLEQSLRILDLVSLELKSGKTPNLYAVSLGFNTYYLK